MSHLYDWPWIALVVLALAPLLHHEPPPASTPVCSAFSQSVVVITPDLVRSNQVAAAARAGTYDERYATPGKRRIGAVRPAWLAAEGLGPAAPELRINFTIELAVRNERLLTRRVNEIYRRGSPRHRQYYATGEYERLHEPTPGARAALIRRLARRGVDHHHSVGRLLLVSAPVSAIDAAFHTSMTRYGDVVAAAYDAVLEDDEPLIIALLNLYTPRRKRQPRATPNGPVGSNATTDWSMFRMLYNVPYDLLGAGQSVGIVGEPICLSDIQMFEANFMTGTGVDVAVNYRPAPGYTASASCDTPEFESTTDVSAIVAMAPHLDQVLIYASSDQNSVAAQVMASDNIVAVGSTSWATDDDPGTLSGVLAQMAAQGQTFFSASGDNGCATGLGPQDQPLLTAVGGTYTGANWETQGLSFNVFPGEGSWYCSGGGPGSTFPTPTWQAQAVQGNAQTTQPYRYVPDMASYSYPKFSPEFDVYFEGTFTGLYGTSIAAPTVAAWAALTNAYLAQNGLPRLGFLNPLIYEIYASASYDYAFRDMNDGVSNAASGCSPGYTAVEGWDAVTGLGSMNATNLMTAVAQMVAGCSAPAPPQVFSSAVMPLQSNLVEAQTGMFSLSWPTTTTSPFSGSALTNPATSVVAPAAAIRLGVSYSMAFWALVTGDHAPNPTYFLSSAAQGQPDSFFVIIPGGSQSQLSFGHGPVAQPQATYQHGSSLYGTWFHAAVAFDASAQAASIWINGQLLVLQAAATTSGEWQGGSQMVVGGPAGYPLVGSMRCAAWFEYALSSSQVTALYAGQEGGGCSLAGLPP